MLVKAPEPVFASSTQVTEDSVTFPDGVPLTGGRERPLAHAAHARPLLHGGPRAGGGGDALVPAAESALYTVLLDFGDCAARMGLYTVSENVLDGLYAEGAYEARAAALRAEVEAALE